MKTMKKLAVGAFVAATMISAPVFAQEDAGTASATPAAGWGGWGRCLYANRTEGRSYSWCYYVVSGRPSRWVYSFDNLIEDAFFTAAGSDDLVNFYFQTGNRVRTIQLR